MARNDFRMQFGIMDGDKWTGRWTSPVGEMVASTLQGLRAPSHYWVISDAQLKRDLKGRTIKDVYRDNRAGRHVDVSYTPRTIDAPSIAHGPRGGGQSLLQEYLADCYARGHVPHPASLDADHPINAHRERAPRRDVDAPLAMAA